MKTDLSKYDNRWYKKEIGASRGKSVAWYCVSVLIFQSRLVIFSGLKVVVLRAFGAVVGKGVVVKPGVNIKYPWKLTIGDFVWIGESVWIDNLDRVTIGSNVCISQGAYLLNGNHNYSTISFNLSIAPITICDGVWIGAKAVVCPGVICGEHSVLAVQSVANRNLEPFGIYQGNPATQVRKRKIT